MTWISATDPLALIAIQSGQIGTPSSESGAEGSSKLDTQQRAVRFGEPVPIVFARRRNSKGGILISPGATEARFENSVTNAVTAYYHLVLSEGQIDSIPVKDVFQRACRVGTHTQTYDRRAGTWTPGNFIVQRSGYDLPECPFYCGSVGAYDDMSTVSFQVTIPDGFDQWNRQVHFFIRGGMHVTRLYDSVIGASDNFADLVKWMFTNSSRLPSGLIDNTALMEAATFLEANEFTCNCYLTESRNISELLADWAPYFLLGESNNAGKKGLRPLLPTNANGTIKTTAITAEYVFTESIILPGSLEINYTSLADRLPFVAQMVWRQQQEDDIGLVRTADVRYEGTAQSGPYESHDISAFCTNENHAVKIGAYLLAKRVYTTHTIRFAARPEAHSTVVTPGSIIRVRLLKQATLAASEYHDFLYQVERITKTLAGELSYECTHFPIDEQGRSLVALDVDAATGSGLLLTSNKSGVTCDINSSTDNTIPAESWSLPDFDAINAGFGFNLNSTYVGNDEGGDGLDEASPEEYDPYDPDSNPEDGEDNNDTLTQEDLAELGIGDASLEPIDTGNPSASVRIYVISGNLFCNNGACYSTIQLATLLGGSPWVTTTEAAQTAYEAVVTAIPPSVEGVSISGSPPIGGDCNDLCAGALPNTTGGCYCPGVQYIWKLTNNGADVVTNRISWNRLPRIVYRSV